MANTYPWARNIEGAEKPFVGFGKVQAGSSATIARGDICVFNETSGYFVKADAVADAAYSLAIANQEQKSDDLARYIEFIFPRRGDVFEFQLAAARQAAYGDALTLTASNAQKLTYDADGVAVAVVCGHQNYPETGTTLGSITYAEVMFLDHVSYYYKNIVPQGIKKVLTKTAAYTLKIEDCGAVVSSKGASGSVTITAPGSVPAGWHCELMVGADQALVFDPKPDTAKLYVKGAAQAAGKTMSMTDIGDFARVVFDGTDWLVTASPSGADADITIES